MHGTLITSLIVALTVTAAPAQRPLITLSGTSATLDDASGPARLASYVLTSDAGNRSVGYLRVRDAFVKTPYRQVAVAKGGRWAAGVPGYKSYLPAHRIVLIDRVRHAEYSVRTPVGVTSAQWSPDGRRLLLTAFRPRDTSYKTIGFVTMTVTGRTPRLVKAGPGWTGMWDLETYGLFYWNADGTGVLSALPNYHDVAAYDLSGHRTRLYRDVGYLEGPANSLFSPSGRLFVSAGDGRFAIVDADTGKVVHRLHGGFRGWYDDDRVIVMRRTDVAPPIRPTATFRLVSLGGKAGPILIRERLRYLSADYAPHLRWVDFSH
jgi:hypothetical protein